MFVHSLLFAVGFSYDDDNRGDLPEAGPPPTDLPLRGNSGEGSIRGLFLLEDFFQK
jgi:hypothetical protein